MNNKFIFLIVMLTTLLCVTFVSANSNITAVNLITPTNNSYDGDGTATFVFNVTGDLAGINYSCFLYDNFDGTFNQNVLNFNLTVKNDTNTNLIETGIADGTYLWNIGCYSTGNSSVQYATNNYTLNVDDTDPVVTINYPTSNSVWYATNTAPTIGLTVVDNSAAECVLGTNLNVTSNTTGTYDAALQTYTYTNNTQFNFSNINSSNAWDDNNTGAYLWTYICNDSAGNTATLGSNYTFYVDTLAPTAPTLAGLYIGSATLGWTSIGDAQTSTDYTPRINWTVSTENNFSRYTIVVYNSSSFVSANEFYSANESTKSLDYHIVTSDLTADTTLYFNITAYDVAGNSNTSATKYTYTTDSTCHTLSTGWNICSYIRTAGHNASDLCTETSCSYISKYNSSHEFQTYTSGGSTNGDLSFNATNTPDEDAVMFIYVATDTSWETRYWQQNTPELYFNLTNYSTGWNLVPILNQSGVNFEKLDNSINGNGTQVTLTNISNWMSFYNNSAASGSKAISFVRNWSINNATTINYGEAVWIHLNKTLLSYEWNASGEI